MSVLTLTLIQKPVQNVDMSPLIPERLAGKSLETIGRMRLSSGNKKIAVKQLFELEGEAGDSLQINKATERLELIGAGMTSGSIDVRGNAGDYLGFAMQAGRIKLKGNAADWLGSNMKNGHIEVTGNVGDYMASARPGDPQGMKGGVIHVRGNVGARLGDRMRRGMIAIEGDTGDYCGARMLAGTIVVLGQVGEFPGYAMKRGTLLMTQKPVSIPASFNFCGKYKPVFLGLVFRDLINLSKSFKAYKDFLPTVERYAGDLSWDGKGEILIMHKAH